MWQEKKQELYQEFIFKDFNQAFGFIKLVAVEAEKQNHHPRWSQDWNKVQIWLSTHEGDNKLTDKDRTLAKSIESLYKDHQKVELDDKKTTKMIELKLYTDGGSRGNPGPSAGGYVIFDKDNNILVKKGIYLGVSTNNQAEYRALKFGLEEVRRLRASHVLIFMDSLLVVNQMIGKYKVRDLDLQPIQSAITDIVKSFQKVSFSHIPRGLNKLADAMVNQALDQKLNNLN